MITKAEDINTSVSTKGGKFTCCKQTTFYGLSTDSKDDCKAMGAKNADIFYEMDTKKLYLFDAQNKVWLEQ